MTKRIGRRTEQNFCWSTVRAEGRVSNWKPAVKTWPRTQSWNEEEAGETIRHVEESIHLIRFQKEETQPEAVFEEIIAENFPELMKDRGRNGQLFGEGERMMTWLLKYG